MRDMAAKDAEKMKSKPKVRRIVEQRYEEGANQEQAKL